MGALQHSSVPHRLISLVALAIALITLVCLVLLVTNVEKESAAEIVWNFSSPQAAEGWSPGHSVSELVVEGEALCFNVTGYDPWIYLPPLNVRAEDLYVFEVEVAASKGSALKLYWVTDESPQWGEDKAFAFPIEADNEFHIYAIDLRVHEMWKGGILRLRLDLEPPDVAGARVRIRYAALKSKPPQLEIAYAGPSTPLVAAGKTFSLRVRLYNFGGKHFKSITVRAILPSGAVSATAQELPPLKRLEVTLSGLRLEEEGVYTIPVVAEADSVRVSKNVTFLVVAGDEGLELDNGGIKLKFVGRGGIVKGFLIYGKKGCELELLSVTAPVSRVVYVSEEGKVVEDIVTPRVEELSNEAAALSYSREGLYEVKLSFRLASPERIDVRYVLRAQAPLKLLRFDGPWLHVGGGRLLGGLRGDQRREVPAGGCSLG